MKEPISIKEIVAIIVRRGKAVLCMTLITSVLAGAFQFVQQYNASQNPRNSAEYIESTYQSEMEDYKKLSAPTMLLYEAAQKKLEKQKEYNEISLFMQIDPFNKYESSSVIAITEVEEGAFQQIYDLENSPMNDILGKIQNHYQLFWNGLDLNSSLKNHPYTDYDEKYIREVLSVSYSGGGTLIIKAISDTAEGAKALHDAAYECVMSIKPTIEETTYAHNLTLINRVDKVFYDHNLETMQAASYDNIDTYTSECLKYEQQLKAIKQPTKGVVFSWKTAVSDIVTWSVLGLVVGFLLACVLVWGKYIVSDGIESSAQLAGIIGVPYFGATTKHGFLDRIACKLIGERQWKTLLQAQSYITENLKTTSGDVKQILVLSTQAVEENYTGLQAALEALKESCDNITFVNEADVNPETLKQLRNCKNVVLAECIGASSRQNILNTMDIVKQSGAQVVGFVLI